ncbi:MAG TPA: hypothetical protein VFW60_07730 [Rhodanobacteraceae bacterium]|nr:hypothetical protein [Rhodanobacteraceae bacterium]
MNAATGPSAMSAFQSKTANARGTAEWLRLAAAPAFALMAVLTGVLEHGAQDMLCPAMRSPLAGMLPMYVLMSAVHLPPWLKLIARTRAAGRL